jgi:cytochrome c553
MIKNLTIKTIALSSVLFVLTGCGGDDKTAAKTEQTVKEVSSQSAKVPQIEIVQSSDSKAIKVKEKEKVSRKDGQKDKYYYDYNIKSEYDPNAKPANEDAAVRTKPRTAIEANMNVRSPYEKIQISMLVKKLSIKFMVKCSACHDDYANGVIGPSLLGKSSDEIFSAIADFKSGKKTNVLMSDLIKMMSEDEIRTLADEIYSFNEQIKELRK